MKIHRTVELFRTSEMPDDGWFQACLHCHQITAVLYYYKTTEEHKAIIEYVAYLCPDCHIKVSDLTFKEKIHKLCERRIAALSRTSGSKTPSPTTRSIQLPNQSNLKRR